MRRGTNGLVASTWLIVSALSGCGGDDPGDESTGGGGSGRGTAACQDWQDAICDFAADRCGAISRSQCDRQYQGIECATDAKASECSNKLNEAGCGSPVMGCDWADVGNTRPAIAKCEGLVQAICGYEMRCGGADLMTCTEMREQELGDCSLAIGATGKYENCLQAVQGASCSMPLDLQSTCGGVLLFSK